MEAGPAGTPLLADVPHRMVVRRVALLDEGGDHVALTTEPIAAETGGSCRPLQLSAANGLAPGHTSEERNNP